MEDLLSWKFKEELLLLVEGCIGNKKKTARRKASLLFEKYHPIINHKVSYYKKQYRKESEKTKCLRSGVITFDGGFVKLSEIESIKTEKSGLDDKKSINVHLKSGEDMSFTEDYEWLLNLF